MRPIARARRATRATSFLIVLALAGLAVAACAGASVPLPQSAGEATGASGAGRDAAKPATDQAAPGAVANGGTTSTSFQEDARIVRTGTLTLQVADVDGALAKAQTAIKGLGGYVSASTQSNGGDVPTATITYRVPVGRWDDALAALRGVAAKVIDEHTEAVEVTGQLVDLAARIRNLQASEQALQAILEKAVKIPDVLAVQQQLSDVRGQIEQLQGQQSVLQDQTAYGTITVTYSPQVVAVTQAARQWDPGAEIDHALASLVDILQGVATAGIWFAIVWLPVLLVLGLLALLIALAVRRSGRSWRRPGPPAQPGSVEAPTAPAS